MGTGLGIAGRQGDDTYDTVLGALEVGIGDELAHGVEHLLELSMSNADKEERDVQCQPRLLSVACFGLLVRPTRTASRRRASNMIACVCV